MPTKRESVCCYEIKHLGSLLEDPHIEILSILLHCMKTLTRYASIEVCLLLLFMYIDIGMKILRFLLINYFFV